MPTTSMPRDAMSVATKTRKLPLLNPANASLRWLSERLECISEAVWPIARTALAIREAIYFVLVKINVGPL